VDAENYRLRPEMGGGALWDVGIYPLSYARTLLGEPLEVFGWQVTAPTGTDETFAAQLRFPGNIYTQLNCSMALPYHTYMEIVGSEATLVIPTPYSPGLKCQLYISRKGKTEIIMVKGMDTYAAEVEDMARAILDGAPSRVTLEDSRANVAAVRALFESARTGKPVTL
jgi:predicted dehydrogenase